MASAGQKKQAAQRAKRRAADMTVEAPPRRWVQAQQESDPRWDQCEVHSFGTGSEEWECQIYQRIRIDPKNKLVDFAVAIQIRERGSDAGWIDVERVDCAHGEVHVDRSNGDKDFACVPKRCRDDLRHAYLWALEYVWDIEDRLKGLL